MALPADDAEQCRPDVAKAAALADRRPTVQLEKGLERTIEYAGRRLVADVG